MQYENRIQRMQQQIKDAQQAASGLTPQGYQCSGYSLAKFY